MKMSTAVGFLFVVSMMTYGMAFLEMDAHDLYERIAYTTAHEVDKLTASVFFADSVTEASLKETYRNAERSQRKIRVLVVPGHDAESWGTQFNGLKEHDLNVAVGEELYRLLRKDSRIEAFLSQTTQGYDPVLLSYFQTHQDAVQKFINDQKGSMESFVSTGAVKRVVGVIHNTAPSETALKLYGINLWANENNIDVVLHLHFNDYPGRGKTASGKYSGFAIYVPERQFSNAKGSRSVAESIHKRLEHLYAPSDFPREGAGVVEDQELIAVGSNNSLNGAGMLIEYGYIYEPSLTNPETRTVVLHDLALQTYLGIMDFFGQTTTEGGEYKTRFVPHDWENDLEEGVGEIGDDAAEDVVRLQAALALQGLYPPPGKEKNDCAITGYFGPCTQKSVKAFQEKYGISPATGFVGEKTRAKLHELF